MSEGCTRFGTSSSGSSVNFPNTPLGTYSAQRSAMALARIRLVSGPLLSIVAMGALFGCSGGAGGPGAGEGNSVDAGPRTLNAGGNLAAPFTCAHDPVQGEPQPGTPFLEQLRVQAGLDFLEERPVVDSTADAGAPRAQYNAGTSCSGAADRAACETALGQLSSERETLRPPFDEADLTFFGASHPKIRGYYLAYTKGDVVGKVSNRSELLALFPTIDTPAKALLYANAAGYRVECHHGDGWLREEPNGWVIVASRDHDRRCTRTDVLLWLGKDGTTDEREVIEKQPDACT